MVGAERSIVGPESVAPCDNNRRSRAGGVKWRRGQLIPLHDVVALVRNLLSLSDASYIRELVLPAIADERF